MKRAIKIRNFFRRILGIPAMSDAQFSLSTIEKIRNGGGYVGDNVDILGSTIDMGEPYLISIGDNVTITGVKILTHDASTKKSLGYSKTGKVHIGNNVFVGWGSIILPNTTIGNNVVIGAGTVVAKDIPDNVVVAGNPVRVLFTYDEYIEKNKKLMSEKPVFDLFPDQLMTDEEAKVKLVDVGSGYML